jgi:hypothetical protein
MRILYIFDSNFPNGGGCWFYRNYLPILALRERGHAVSNMVLGLRLPENIRQILEPFDVLVFSRTYPTNPLELLRLAKGMGKRIIFEVDDDFWTINSDNPALIIGTAQKDTYEAMITEADAITTTTEHLAKKLKKLNKNVFICPNAINYHLGSDSSQFKPRNGNNEKLVIGYTGASSHFSDLNLVIDVILELQKKYDFTFILQGLVGSPLDAEMFMNKLAYDMNIAPEQNHILKGQLEFFDKYKQINDAIHIPFYPPQMYPGVLRTCNFDIGIAPLADNEFNRNKSCIKFYEYGATGTACLASDVSPYKDEVGYTAKNNNKDWYNKLEKLIVDKDFRDKLAEKQNKWVKENRDLKFIGLKWELAFQKPGGLEVKNQNEEFLKNPELFINQDENIHTEF